MELLQTLKTYYSYSIGLSTNDTRDNIASNKEKKKFHLLFRSFISNETILYQWFRCPSVLPSLKQMTEENKSVNKNQWNAYKYSPEPVCLKKKIQQHHSHYKSQLNTEKF